MTDKGMFVLQDCAHSQEDVPGSCVQALPTSSYNAFEAINMKVEEVSDVEEEEDPLSITFPGVGAEREVSCFVSSLTDSRASVAACFVYLLE
jgi:hypothetical protein